MSSWQTPKTTWGQAGQTVPGAADFNRIEGNIQYLQDTKETPAGAQAKADAAATVVQANLDAHKADYIRQPGYATATGSANTYSITLNPAPTAYVDGMAISVKINVDNTGASTINVNGLGARSIKKPNGNDLVSGNLKAGSVYTVRYNGTNFILQGSDSTGTATPGDVTAGKTFSNDDDTDLVGTLPILGNRSTTLIINGPGTPQVVIPPGRIDQSTIVAQIDPSKASIIKHGETLGGVTGALKESLYFTDSFVQPYGSRIIQAEFDCPFVPTMILGRVVLGYNNYALYIDQYRSIESIDGYFDLIDKMVISQQGGSDPVINTTVDGYGRTGNAFVSYSDGKININFTTTRQIVTPPASGFYGVRDCRVKAWRF